MELQPGHVQAVVVTPQNNTREPAVKQTLVNIAFISANHTYTVKMHLYHNP